MTRYLFAALLVVVGLPFARAADPQVNTMSPYGMRRGTEAEWTISGTGMTGAKELLFYTPGFTVTNLQSSADDTLKATVSVAPDCQLGIHAFRIRSTSGVR